MAIEVAVIKQTFEVLTSSFQKAVERKISIDEEAMSYLLWFVGEQLRNADRLDEFIERVKGAPMKFSELISKKESGATLSVSDIIEWIKLWWPDYLTGSGGSSGRGGKRQVA